MGLWNCTYVIMHSCYDDACANWFCTRHVFAGWVQVAIVQSKVLYLPHSPCTSRFPPTMMRPVIVQVQYSCVQCKTSSKQNKYILFEWRILAKCHILFHAFLVQHWIKYINMASTHLFAEDMYEKCHVISIRMILQLNKEQYTVLSLTRNILLLLAFWKKVECDCFLIAWKLPLSRFICSDQWFESHPRSCEKVWVQISIEK